ncbi:hypothetical protein [Luethyella okanaganae]|uniref:Uncharacterized protein n=1 Tax=Luethyella okanaganae TaxID=69372 RepID=A0ABW1VI63_9MICO
MKSRFIVPLALVASLSLLGLVGCQAAAPASVSSQTSVGSGSTASGVLPVDSNPINNTSTAPGLSIVAAAVEDNVDPVTKAALGDRLQVTLKNSTTKDLSAVEIYYLMTDVTTGQTEGYYQSLSGLTLPAGAETTIFFDNETGPGHFPENVFSLYRSSVNQVDFAIEVSADGVQLARATASKGAGTGEKVD